MARPAIRRTGDEGFTILETVIALTLFGLIIAGVAGSFSLGLKIVGGSSARQNATQLANQEVERLRASGYATLGHATAPPPLATPDENNPDNAIRPAILCNPNTRPCYEVPGVGLETFVEGLSPTVATAHGPDTVTLGGQRFSVFRYVTVATGAPDLKRLTVVVQASGPAPKGGPNRVVLSTLFSTGAIEF